MANALSNASTSELQRELWGIFQAGCSCVISGSSAGTTFYAPHETQPELQREFWGNLPGSQQMSASAGASVGTIYFAPQEADSEDGHDVPEALRLFSHGLDQLRWNCLS